LSREMERKAGMDPGCKMRVEFGRYAYRKGGNGDLF
jgi:hypothetical protein